jgi:serine phosphatase RsbU (regulator of sigma subunit)
MRIGPIAPAEIVRKIVAELDQFAAGHEPDDDQTLLVAGFD